MRKAQRPIDPNEFHNILRTKAKLKTLPERVCSEHGEEVTIDESEFRPNSGGAVTFAKAAYTACCDAAIDNALAALIKASGNR